MNIEKRHQQFEEIKNFLTSLNTDIDSVLTNLGWTRNDILQNTPQTSKCPFNPGHSVPFEHFEKHKEFCSLRQLGYKKEEIPKLPASPPPVDHSILHRLDDENLTLNPTNNSIQTKALLELEETLERRIKEHEASNEDASGPHSQLQLLASMRDVKRHRQKYKVHTARKTHTEVVRDVINNQMELLTELWAVERRLTNDIKRRSRSYSPKSKQSVRINSRLSRSRSPLRSRSPTVKKSSESQSPKKSKSRDVKKSSKSSKKEKSGIKKKKKKNKKERK